MWGMNPQQVEEWEYQMGAASEQQNALTVSRMEMAPDDRAAANELVSLGRFVLVSEYSAYCPRTDALMGSRLWMVGDYATHDEALAAMRERDNDPDEYVHILSPVKPVLNPVPELTPDEIPF